MIPLRIIPLILLEENKVIKTQQFQYDKYIGDPINSLKIFNDKNVDEITIIDIKASLLKKINYPLLKDMIEEFNFPISYGGGISTVSTAKKLIKMGIEKIIINAKSFDYDFILELVKTFGAQSISICLDIKQHNKKYFLYDYQKKTNYPISIKSHIERLQQIGVGEIIINNVTKDGMMNGFDLNLMSYFQNSNCEIVCLGGMEKLEDIISIINHTSIKSFCIGSYFLYTSKLQSVLLNYISTEDRKFIINNINNGKKYV